MLILMMIPMTKRALDDSYGNDLECLDDDGSDGDEDEADGGVPDEGGHPVGDRAH